jgi:hypothetical protein
MDDFPPPNINAILTRNLTTDSKPSGSYVLILSTQIVLIPVISGIIFLITILKSEGMDVNLIFVSVITLLLKE